MKGNSSRLNTNSSSPPQARSFSASRRASRSRMRTSASTTRSSFPSRRSKRASKRAYIWMSTPPPGLPKEDSDRQGRPARAHRGERARRLHRSGAGALRIGRRAPVSASLRVECHTFCHPAASLRVARALTISLDDEAGGAGGQHGVARLLFRDRAVRIPRVRVDGTRLAIQAGVLADSRPAPAAGPC